MARIRFKKVRHAYPPPKGQQPVYALKGIDQIWEDEGAYALLGPSGCGKTTLLNIISGLLTPSEGEIYFDGQDVTNLPTSERQIAQVFQFPVVYDTMTVFDNLAFPLRNRGMDEARVEERVKQIAEMLDLSDNLKKRASGLTTDGKQKISLGRGLVRSDVNAILFDEPLTVIDPHLKWQLRRKLKEIHEQLKLTLIYVTHDQVEAMTMGDRIAVMNAGQIQQVAPPLELYHRPANRFVAEFIGSPPMNFLPVEVQRPTLLCNGQFRMTLPEIWTDVLASYVGQPLWLGIRPEHWQVAVPAPKNLRVQVAWIESLGHETYAGVTPLEAHLSLGNLTTATLPQVRTSGDFAVNVGDELWLAVASDRLHLFDPATGVALRP